MNNAPKDLSDTESQKQRKRMRVNIEPFQAKKRMLLKDAPHTIREEGVWNNGNTWIVGFASHKIIQHWKQARNEQDTSSGNENVQILEQVKGECKNQVVTVSQAGGKPPIFTDQEEQGRASRNGKSFRRWYGRRFTAE